jgi:hypothetical protein
MAEKTGTQKPATNPQQAAGAGKTKGITKMEGVRRALGSLGKNATPLDIQGFLKREFNLAMTREYISKYKNLVLKERGKTKRAAKAAVGVTASKTPSRAASTGNGKISKIGLPDLWALKQLVGRIGADSLKQLIDLLGE